MDQNSNPAPQTVTLRLNQQQLELLERTIAKGVAASREDLVRLALREYTQNHGEQRI
ncbi:ribbon-helix-helix domain-containing protein [Falsihalocynthiibacter arcticus]|uniref:ribbon-helix-helix domain-containing protein n=1 Tax=Falsihalocynthiibacter arcticus TaxID=1579316 RepID=UPI0009EE84D7